MIPIINKPIRVTRKTATAIDHIVANCFTKTIFRNVIFKIGKSDHFSICFLVSLSPKKGKTKHLLFVKEYLTQNQMNHLRKSCNKLIGKKLEPLKLHAKHIKHFCKSFLPCMIIILLKKD